MFIIIAGGQALFDRKIVKLLTFRHYDNRELKQRRRRRQRERQKSNLFRLAKQQLCTCIIHFCTFLWRRCTPTTRNPLFSRIDLVTVFDAILTSRQTREKLQCLYENLMSNNFRKTAVLKKKEEL